MKTSITSWDDDQLEKLCDFKNHRIIYDGYNYVWENNITGHWKLHSIKLFDDQKKPFEWLNYWLYKWDKEHMKRLFGIEYEIYFNSMKKNLKVSVEIYDISKLKIDTKEKIKRILSINPDIKVKQLCDMLDRKRSIVHRHIRNI